MTELTPFMRAEAIKRDYTAKLDRMVAEYHNEIGDALEGAFSPEYVLAEIDGYTWRLLRRMEQHREVATTRAAEAEKKRNGRRRRSSHLAANQTFQSGSIRNQRSRNSPRLLRSNNCGMVVKDAHESKRYRSEAAAVLRRTESAVDWLVSGYINVCAKTLSGSNLSPSQKLELAENGMLRLVRRIAQHAQRVSAYAGQVRESAK